MNVEAAELAAHIKTLNGNIQKAVTESCSGWLNKSKNADCMGNRRFYFGLMKVHGFNKNTICMFFHKWLQKKGEARVGNLADFLTEK